MHIGDFDVTIFDRPGAAEARFETRAVDSAGTPIVAVVRTSEVETLQPFIESLQFGSP
jgi:hypothetical protein